jgi:hypothetical protein
MVDIQARSKASVPRRKCKDQPNGVLVDVDLRISLVLPTESKDMLL